MPTLYLSCLDCGEVFDEFNAARDHETDQDCSQYEIVPESEAF